jgi:hypothetical protein
MLLDRREIDVGVVDAVEGVGEDGHRAIAREISASCVSV